MIRKRRADAISGGEDVRTPEEIVQDLIDSVAQDDLVPVEKRKSVKKLKRFANWEDVALESQLYGHKTATKNFPEAFEGASDTIYQRINNWLHDLKDKKATPKPNTRICSYGNEIDSQLLQDCETRRDVGLPMDDAILRRLLVVHLTDAGLGGQLSENGGKFSYGHSWAMRFYRRHNLVSRVCTTKMKELPADFEAKIAVYMKIGAELIYKHRVPLQLVINGDETAVLLVNRAKITRNRKGAKRVKILGMGDDKAQITATIFVTESGDVLPYQMIFAGTTKKCHPKTVKPDDCFWMHTSSHWQSVVTYVELIESVIVPYKNKVIAELRLPEDLVTILKRDLHFTHKDTAVLKCMRDNHIYPL